MNVDAAGVRAGEEVQVFFRQQWVGCLQLLTAVVCQVGCPVIAQVVDLKQLVADTVLKDCKSNLWHV